MVEGIILGSYDVGKNTLLPYLLDRRIKKLDLVIVSHMDSDHILGIFTILENLNVKKIFIPYMSETLKLEENYKTFEKIVKEKNIKVISLSKGMSFQIEKNVYMDVLWPDEKTNRIEKNEINNNSLVFKIKYNNFSALFTGDIEKIAEEKISNIYKEKLKADVLKVAHHGSKGSSDKTFLDYVLPKIALIGVGEKNTFGHPR